MRSVFSFLTIFSFTFLAYGNCSKDPGQDAKTYLQHCKIGETCRCMNGGAGDIQNYHLSKPIPEARVLKCSKIGALTATPIIEINNSQQGKNGPLCDLSKNEHTNFASRHHQDYFGDYIKMQTTLFRNNCGYERFPSATEVRNYFSTIINPDQGPTSVCSNSMCTSASYSVLLLAAQELKKLGRLPESFKLKEIADTNSKSWRLFNEAARPDLALQELGIGSGKIISKSNFNDCIQKNWPSSGDFVQIWRKNNSGHSVVFSNFLKNKEGKPIGVCYWSSNQETKGTQNRCESIENIEKMIIGRITL